MNPDSFRQPGDMVDQIKRRVVRDRRRRRGLAVGGFVAAVSWVVSGAGCFGFQWLSEIIAHLIIAGVVGFGFGAKGVSLARRVDKSAVEPTPMSSGLPGFLLISAGFASLGILVYAAYVSYCLLYSDTLLAAVMLIGTGAGFVVAYLITVLAIDASISD